MNWRYKLADWISGGLIHHWYGQYCQAETQRRGYRSALISISRNTCCDGCQEAALVAREALK